MPSFQTTLVAGSKRPYDTWTFIVLPHAVVEALGGRFPLPVRGALAGTPFRGTASRGEGVCRIPVTRDLQASAGVTTGSDVSVTIEPDPEPRPVEIPAELQVVLDRDPDLPGLFAAMAASHRRAWAAYVGDAKRPETRRRRAAKAPDGIRSCAFPT